MGVLTSFLKLFKPAPNDYVDVEKHLNENYDKIDTWAKDLIVNDLTTGGAAKAGSADMVKKLGEDKQNKTDDELKTPTKTIVGGMNDLTWYQKPKRLIGGDRAENAIDLLEYIKTLEAGIYRCDYSKNGWFKNLPTPIFNSETPYQQDFFLTIKNYKEEVWEGTTQIEFVSEDDYGFFRAIIQYNISTQKYTSWELFFANTYKYGYAPFGIADKTKFFIQDKITKSFNETYIDKTTGKIYRCIATTTDDITVTSNFEIVTNNELAKRNSEYIVEYKEIDEYTRYRKWNSGLLEMWGIEEETETVRNHKIKFPVSFANTDYQVQLTYQGEAGEHYCNVKTSGKAITSCEVIWEGDTNYRSPYYAVGKWK